MLLKNNNNRIPACRILSDHRTWSKSSLKTNEILKDHGHKIQIPAELQNFSDSNLYIESVNQNLHGNLFFSIKLEANKHQTLTVGSPPEPAEC